MAKNRPPSTPGAGPSITSRTAEDNPPTEQEASDKPEQKTPNTKKKRQIDYDPLIADSIFPDASAVFTALPIPLSQVKDTACVVLDTSTLLLPYEVGKNSLEKVESVYKKLIEKKRLFVPAQVAREFARNRARKLGELYQTLTQRRDQFQPKLLRPQDKYPLLESFREGQQVGLVEKRLGQLDRQIENVTKEYQDRLSAALERIRSWEWDDPVSQMYARLFNTDRVVYPSHEADHIRAEHERRYIHQIPPGLDDQSKDDGGIGDLLIWFTIIDIGKTQQQSVIFVTGEKKSDWWHHSGGKPLYPRYELLDEFRRHTKNSFHMLHLSTLLEQFGATTQVIEEVRDKEEQATQSALHDRKLAKMPSTGTLEEARRQEASALAVLASLPADSPNDSLALPWSREWHRAQQNLATARQRIAELEAEIPRQEARASDRYTGLPCSRCGHLTFGSFGSNGCGNCGYITDD